MPVRGIRRSSELTETAGGGDFTRATELDAALAALGEEDREVFLLKEIGGLSYSEIADACDLTPDAVRSRLPSHAAEPENQRWAHQRLPRPAMNDTHFDIISAFLDGEAVDPDALARTLRIPTRAPCSRTS